MRRHFEDWWKSKPGEDFVVMNDRDVRQYQLVKDVYMLGTWETMTCWKKGERSKRVVWGDDGGWNWE